MNPLSDCIKASEKNSGFSIPNSILLEAKFKGYKIKAVSEIQSEFYLRLCIPESSKELWKPSHMFLKNEMTEKSKGNHYIELINDDTGKTEAFVSLHITTHQIKVENLIVSTRKRKTGLGGLLINLVKAVAFNKAIKIIKLTSMPESIKFYEKYGFTMFSKYKPFCTALMEHKVSFSKNFHIWNSKVKKQEVYMYMPFKELNKVSATYDLALPDEKKLVSIPLKKV